MKRLLVTALLLGMAIQANAQTSAFIYVETVFPSGNTGITVVVLSVPPAQMVTSDTSGMIEASGLKITDGMELSPTNSHPGAGNVRIIASDDGIKTYWKADDSGGGGGAGTVTQWWDSIHAESVGLAVGPAQPRSFVTNLVFGAVTQQFVFLEFDDTTEQYTGPQTRIWPFSKTNLIIRGSTWYTDLTPDGDWSLWYLVNGLTQREIVLNPTVAASSVTNLDTWTISTVWVGVSQGDTIKYWTSRDVGGDSGTGHNYFDQMILYGLNQ